MINHLPVKAKAFIELVKVFIKTVVDSTEQVGKHHFRNRATLGFISSSIVKGSNPGIKNSDFASKSTKHLDTSSMQ